MASYSVQIRQNDRTVDNADTAQAVLINVHGGGNVEHQLADGRWIVSNLPMALLNRIDRQGLVRGFTRTVGRDLVAW